MEEEERPGRLRRFVPVRLRPSEPRQKATRRQRFAQLAAGGAVVICLVGAWGVVRDPFGESTVRAGQLIGATGDDSVPQAVGAAQTSPVQRARSVPKGFELSSMSVVGHNAWFGLGTTRCGADSCPAVIKSTDGGHSWVLVHTFQHTDTSASTGVAEPSVQPSGAMSGVTFVTMRIGYVFGGDLWMTTDGGASFTRLPHPHSTVLDVVARGKTLDLLTAEGCVQGSCSGRLDIARMPAGSRGDLPQPIAGVTLASAVYSARLVAAGPDLVVLTQGASTGTGDSPGAWRLTGDVVSALPVRGLCHGNPVLAASAAGRNVVAACDASPAASTTSYSVIKSADTGRSWSSLGSGNVSLPTEGRFDIATNDGTHVVATTGGPRLAADGTNRSDNRGAVVSSSDGGRTWHNPTSAPGDLTGGFDAVIPCGSHVLVALPRNGSTFWQSTDDGASWHTATVTSSSG